MDNMGQTVLSVLSLSEFARKIAKFNINQTICDFDKDWSKFIKWTTWINLYCPWLKFFKNISSSNKELSMEAYVGSLKGQYGSNIFLIRICYKHCKIQHRLNFMWFW